MSTTAAQLPDYLEIILSPFRSDPIIAGHLAAVGSDAGRLFVRIYDGPYDRMSSGEAALVDIALALWNGHREARVADLAKLDDQNRHRACTAIIARYCPLWGQED